MQHGAKEWNSKYKIPSDSVHSIFCVGKTNVIWVDNNYQLPLGNRQRKGGPWADVYPVTSVSHFTEQSFFSVLFCELVIHH